MVSPRIEAFFEEFPWLAKHYEKEKIERVSVLRVGLDFLRKMPIYDRWGHLPRPTFEYFEKISLFDRNGNWLGNVGLQKKQRLLFGSRTVIIRETVGEAIFRQRLDPKVVHFAVLLHLDHLTLYKPPKSFSLVDWVNDQIRREREGIRQEIARIDKEPELQEA